MARQPYNIPDTRSVIEAVLRDADGTHALRISGEEWELHTPKGIVNIKRHNSFRLMCGTQWYPALWKAVPVAICEICRHPPYTFPFRERPQHGVVSIARSKECDCGKRLCPRHAKRCSDGKYRCPSCRRRLWPCM